MVNKDIKTVMVVDDNDTDLLIARIVIEKAGYTGQIIIKNSGKSALEFIHTVIAEGETIPEIIFLDINMPVINGYLFLQEFEKIPEEKRKHSKVIMLTSSDNKTDMEQFTSIASVLDFVSKPISIESFHSVSKKYIDT